MMRRPLVPESVLGSIERCLGKADRDQRPAIRRFFGRGCSDLRVFEDEQLAVVHRDRRRHPHIVFAGNPNLALRCERSAEPGPTCTVEGASHKQRSSSWRELICARPLVSDFRPLSIFIDQRRPAHPRGRRQQANGRRERGFARRRGGQASREAPGQVASAGSLRVKWRSDGAFRWPARDQV